MIRSIDFYYYVSNAAQLKQNIQFYYGDIQQVDNEDGKAVALINNKKFTADFLFNSIIFDRAILSSSDSNTSLLQHFKGWLVETKKPAFNNNVATFMDFRVSQKHGSTFVYVLPVTPSKALIEYTLITPQLLQQEAYEEGLKEYIKQFLKIVQYKVIEEETGIIPMTTKPFSKGEDNIVNIGTAGGQTKASSGFTFQFIQKHTAAIITALVNGEHPNKKEAVAKKRFSLYDGTLLHILDKKKLGGDIIFARLFRKNPVQTVLKFLDNETTITEELKIMSSVPSRIFLPAALRELIR
jgi:lycopene beta-cyclase